MRAGHYIMLICLFAAVSLVLCAAGQASDGWSVQGVIDWTGINISGKPHPQGGQVLLIHKHNKYDKRHSQGWDQPGGNGAPKCFVAGDGDIFLPWLHEINAMVSFRVLTGAVILEKGPEASPDMTIDWLQIWLWEDRNNNGKADAADLIDGREQRWECLLEIENPSANHPINIVPRSLDLRAGMPFLLLIRAGVNEKTILQFSGGVACNWPEMRATDWVEYEQEGWQSTGNKRFTRNWSAAVEDREVLSIRINNPPAAPIVP